MLEGIGIPTGGRAITDDLDVEFKNTKLEDLGRPIEDIIDKDNAPRFSEPIPVPSNSPQDLVVRIL